MVRHPDSLTIRISRVWADADAASPPPRARPDSERPVIVAILAHLALETDPLSLQ